MGHVDRQHIKSMQGIFMYRDTPLFEFNIENYNLVFLKEYNRKDLYKFYPAEFTFETEIQYRDFDDYFHNHVVADIKYATDEYLSWFGLSTYDMDELVKRTDGYNQKGVFWVRYAAFGADTWEMLLKQRYPVYK